MTLELRDLTEIVLIVLTLKLIVSRWQPPVQESLQAIICIVIGTGLGIFINPTKEGFITGLIASGFAFYGGDLKDSFKSMKSQLKDENEDMKIDKEV